VTLILLGTLSAIVAACVLVWSEGSAAPLDRLVVFDVSVTENISGAPIPGARVRLFPAEDEDSFGDPVALGYTDSAGRVRLEARLPVVEGPGKDGRRHTWILARESWIGFRSENHLTDSERLAGLFGSRIDVTSSNVIKISTVLSVGTPRPDRMAEK
jgi:hypothetical protein